MWGYLLLLVVIVSSGTWLAVSVNPFIGVIAFVAAVVTAAKIVRMFDANDVKISQLLGAVKNGDMSLRFPRRKNGADAKDVNMLLNEISSILHEARKNVETKERFLEVVLNYLDSGFFVYDESGNVVRQNDAVTHMLDMPVFTHVRQLEQNHGALYDALSGLSSGCSVKVKLSIGKKEVAVTVNCSRLEISNENYTVIALVDIDKYLEAQEVEAWSKLTRVLVHEIMNSLTPVISISETLLHRHDMDFESLKEGVSAINGISMDLLGFVKSYREFAQLPAPLPAIFSVKDFMARMGTLGRQYIHDNDVDIIIDDCADDLMLYADENQMARVCMNIIKNGIESIGAQAGGMIRFKAYSLDGNSVKIEISNNGPVIPEEERDNVFVPFYTTKKQGNGIGLSLSRSIMKANGGSLYLKSYDEEQLTVFVLSFDS